jgi:hypothetical protein
VTLLYGWNCLAMPGHGSQCCESSTLAKLPALRSRRRELPVLDNPSCCWQPWLGHQFQLNGLLFRQRYFTAETSKSFSNRYVGFPDEEFKKLLSVRVVKRP